MSLHRVTSQIPADQQYIQTIVATMWLYPPTDVEKALATTTYTYTFDGIFITCPDIANLTGLYSDIFDQTAQSQPIGNVGFSLGVGTILENFGKKIYFQVPSGNTVIEWTLVKQLTPQSSLPPGVGGDSPIDTVGYITSYTTIGSTAVFEGPYVTFI
jgi:hypothetical protein